MWVRGCSRSLKMVPFDGPYTTSYWSLVGHSRSLKMVLFESMGTVYYLHDTIQLPLIVSEIKRDIRRKSWLFHISLHLTPPLEGPIPSEYWHSVWCKTRVLWLLGGERSLRMCLAVSAQYRRVTDRETDRRTSCESIVRAMHTASRGKNS